MTSSQHDDTAPSLKTRIDALLARIDSALKAAGRDPQTLTILLATKTRDAAEIRAAVEAFTARGITVAVGENRAQEMAKHADLDDLPDAGVTRHFIGRLQTNKARDIVRFADLVHSVDRDDAIDALARRATNDGITQKILIQVNTSGEESKGGYEPEIALVRAAIERARATGALEPLGLMTIGAHTNNTDDIRRSLRTLRELRDALADPSITELSMGMSNDLEIAIEEGATYVRVGSAVFGPRDYA